jgi:hypothetical protein
MEKDTLKKAIELNIKIEDCEYLLKSLENAESIAIETPNPTGRDRGIIELDLTDDDQFGNLGIEFIGSAKIKLQKKIKDLEDEFKKLK